MFIIENDVPAAAANCNKAYADIYALPAELARPGNPFP